jgi:opacity protein-like surface antigen
MTAMKMHCLGLAAAGLAVAFLSVPASAGGSIKDAPVVVERPASHCYFRADVGYSWSRDPEAKFTQTDGGGVFVTDSVIGASLDDSWLVGGGFGCGHAPRGLRAEVMFDWRGDRDLTGTLATGGASILSGSAFSTSVQTSTVMFNAYYDLGLWRDRFVPYIGAGVGVAHHDLDTVSYATSLNTQEGDTKWSLAWSLMAGVGVQLSERVVLDLGYRYIDMGKVNSGTIDSAGFPNPPLRLDDLTAHEFKVGLRFHFGGRPECCAGPMK